MSRARKITCPGPFSRLHFVLLMVGFRFVRNRAGYGRLARGLGRIFGARSALWLTEPGGAPYKIYLNDGYWTRFALFHTHYEPEVAVILHAARGHTPLFCDLGANGGYWTVRAAAHFGQVIAVEASAATFARLKENAAHLPRVTLHRAAIHAATGEVLTFVNTYQSHASARLAGDTAPGPRDEVETVDTLAIDDLVPPGTPALIKLDVEGAEIAALRGAARAIRDGAVIVYEDHGSDPDSAPSEWLMQDDAVDIYALERGLEAIGTLEQLRAIKTDPFKGYNFLAARRDSPLLAAIRDTLQSAAPETTTAPRT